MAREATGELRKLSDGFAALITIKGRTRRAFRLETCSAEPEPQERCKALAEMAARLRRAGHADQIEQLIAMGAKARAGRPWEAVCAAGDALCAGQTRGKGDAPTLPTFVEFAREWYTGKLAQKHPDHVREKRSAGRDEELFRLYVFPNLPEGLSVDEFSLDHAEFVMANVPADLEAGTRRHIAQVMSRLMNLAVYPGKYIKSTPIPRGWLPRAAADKAKACLYPDEDAKLMSGVSNEPDKDGPPLLRRLAYGFLDREGMRTDECGRLTWSDVDLQHNRVDLDENKTDRPRAWDLRPDVLAALKIWRKHFRPKTQPSDRVFVDDDGIPLNVDHLAAHLRDDLARVGVTRTKLFTRSKARLCMRAHDLRATFITVSLANGRTWEWCQDRTGHGDSMKKKYRRNAATWIAQQQGDLAPLHLAIPELAAYADALHADVIATPLPLATGSGPFGPRPIPMKVHGKGVEPLRLSAAEPKAERERSDGR